MKKIINIALVFTAFVILNACGEGVVDIGSENYQAKIVVEAYLSPGCPVDDIKISRNVPLNTAISGDDIYLSNADVRITVIETNKEYKLDYDHVKRSYKYNGNELRIDYNKSYKLTVNVLIDGKQLSAKSVTTTPQKGFSIDKELSISGEIKYREKDQNGNLEKITMYFTPSPGTAFYAFGVVAVDANINNFIYSNPYFKIDTSEVIKDFLQYKYESSYVNQINSGAKQSKEIEWMDTWFYGNYRTIVYAGDQNFKDYFITINQLQEMDGNYHEPKLHFEGDGIGVFGSFIADTVYFHINK
jgi:hypothetical protein